MMLELWKESVNKNEEFGALKADLSKAFAYFSHNLLIAKLHEYGLKLSFLIPFQDYLSYCQQRRKLYSKLGSWKIG